MSSVNRRRTCALFVDVASSAVAADAIRAALARRLRAAEPGLANNDSSFFYVLGRYAYMYSDFTMRSDYSKVVAS